MRPTAVLDISYINEEKGNIKDLLTCLDSIVESVSELTGKNKLPFYFGNCYATTEQIDFLRDQFGRTGSGVFARSKEGKRKAVIYQTAYGTITVKEKTDFI